MEQVANAAENPGSAEADQALTSRLVELKRRSYPWLGKDNILQRANVEKWARQALEEGVINWREPEPLFGGEAIVGEVGFVPGPGRWATGWIIASMEGELRLSGAEEGGRPRGTDVAVMALHQAHQRYTPVEEGATGYRRLEIDRLEAIAQEVVAVGEHQICTRIAFVGPGLPAKGAGRVERRDGGVRITLDTSDDRGTTDLWFERSIVEGVRTTPWRADEGEGRNVQEGIESLLEAARPHRSINAMGTAIAAEMSRRVGRQVSYVPLEGEALARVAVGPVSVEEG